MLRQILATIPLLMSLILAVDAQAARVSVLIDFDPNSAAQTVIVESIAADPRGMLYACDRITGIAFNQVGDLFSHGRRFQRSIAHSQPQPGRR